MSEARPWHKKPGEPDDDFKRFLIYKDLGHERTLVKAQSQANGEPITPCPSGTWGVLCRKWGWKSRAIAYDCWCAERASNKLEEKIVDDLVKAKEYRHKSIALISQRIYEALSDGDDVKLKKNKQILSELVGKGQSANFLLESEKILGEKKDGQEDSGVKRVMIEFKD